MLVVALPCRSRDVGGAPRRLVAELAVRLVASQLLARVAARVGVLFVVAVRLATLLAPRRILVAILAPYQHRYARVFVIHIHGGPKK